jgi:hypothetical protein
MPFTKARQSAYALGRIDRATVPGWLLYLAPPLALLWLGSLFY